MKTLPALFLLVGLAACSTVEKVNPFASDKGPKPAALVQFKQTAELKQVWKAGIGGAGEFVFTPAVVGNAVYAAGRDGALARFDNGTQVWRVNTGKPLAGGVGADGRLVVVGTLKGEVLAYDAATGKPAWSALVTSEVLAAPALGEDLVVVRAGDARVFAFEAATGKRRWVYQRSNPALSLRSNVGVTIAGRATLAGFPGGKLVAIANNNGAALWEATVALPKGATELERVADVTSSPAVDGNEVCAGAFQGRVACFDLLTGNALWARDMSVSAGVDLDKRHVYVADDKGAVHALDRNSGASVWRQDKLALRQLSRPLQLGSHVAVADFEGVVHLLNRDDGAFAARLTTDGSAVRAAPQRSAAGIVVQTGSGGVFALSVK